ncbi:ADP-ribosylglycohydrolase-domain-containing protein [Dunaliella salina]|uniref:ADP-ribosylglycohydrolase-domain-containing protein n=1 Tax=Dunaliella salina TaxID=3046 RepID=A0ABQ7GVP9_DUNSA|nr:ADP-ribosylglycohydrolase-domain-containing protein [Dunaliella salina]|eukprot:KAF5838686.1 ADP-ribosylglycohydrolase-domain-containing protein [Dunaliella salina]
MQKLGVCTKGAVRASGSKSHSLSVHKGERSLLHLKQNTCGSLWKANTTNKPLLLTHRALATDQTHSIMDRATMLDKIRGALWGVLIADSLSMPVHWYYNPQHIVRDFGEITTYQAPKATHPSSIMSLSNTGGHGRGGQSGRIIGDVINHGKHVFWGKNGMHYHQGMKAGENTLNALCARVVTRGIAANGGYDPKHILHEYVKFMTTPGSHNDTYAESFHRDFFANYAKGVPPEKCAEGTEGHNTAQIGGFVMLAPVIMATLPAEVPERIAWAETDALSRTLTFMHFNPFETITVGDGHDAQSAPSIRECTECKLLDRECTKSSEAHANVLVKEEFLKHAKFAGLLYDVSVGGAPLKEAAITTAKSMGVDLEKGLAMHFSDVQAVHGMFGSACYIDSSFPVVLYLAAKYPDSFEKAVLANTNAGGENCHRGAALGALMGAALGESKIPPRLIQGLHDSSAIRQEIDALCSALYPEHKEL